jgi:geranylgeranyl reductase family protein
MTDVLIVGAGPAGSCAAYALAKQGFSVVLLDQKARIGTPNHCGEGVSLWCLEEAGVAPDPSFVRHEVKGCRLRFPNEAQVWFQQRGFSVDRTVFDWLLCQRALSAGARLEQPVSVQSIESQEDGWRVLTSAGAFKGRYLIGAGGARCPVAQSLGQRAPLISAFQYKFACEGPTQALGLQPWLDFYHREAFPGGYGWVFPRGQTVAIGGGGNRQVKPAVVTLCRELGFDVRDAIATEGGPIPFLKKPLTLVFPYLLLCGDSGGFTYPLTKGGIHGAVWSGRLAGETIAKALSRNQPELLAHYGRLVQRHPCRKRGYVSLPQDFFELKDETFNTIGRLMDGYAFHQVPLGRLALELRRHPSKTLAKALWLGLRVQWQYRRSSRFAW